MKEEEFLSIIKSVIGDKYIGDDCAYIKDLGLVITQDSLVEDVHFSLNYMTPRRLGYKSGIVNISDILASGGVPKYMTVSLSLPRYIESEFIKEFYVGLKESAPETEIIGGDITGGDKIMISITVIGSDNGRHISSRKNAKTGYAIVAGGKFGSSAGGLKLLLENNNVSNKLTDVHIKPILNKELSETISKNINVDYAMTDTSDGLADALFKIARASEKTIEADFNKIEFDEELKNIFPNDYKDMILYGGEDYQIIAAVPVEFANKYGLKVIGTVKDYTETPVIIKNFNGKILEINNLEKCYNHFS